tara:strand:- start:1420 stop:1995 length:576 start_codon:yes stop_codon:yes gene_type:complete
MPGGISYIGDLTIQEDGGEITSQAIGDKALKTTAADADTLEVSSSTGKLQIKEAGSSKANGVGRDDMSKYAGFWLKGALSATRTAGGMLAVENSYGSDLIVTRVIISVTSASSGSSTGDIGIAANATTSSNNLMTAFDTSGAGVYDNLDNKGGSGATKQKWGTGQFVTGSEDSGNITGLVGTFAIHAIDMN